MFKKLLLPLLVTGLFVSTVSAADAPNVDRVFNVGEVSLELFGSGRLSRDSSREVTTTVTEEYDYEFDGEGAGGKGHGKGKGKGHSSHGKGKGKGHHKGGGGQGGDSETYDVTSVRSSSDNLWGGGVGLTAYPVGLFNDRVHLGLFGETEMLDNRGSFVDSALGGLTLRVPIEKLRLAPNVRGGAGYDFQRDHEIYSVSGGLDFRPLGNGVTVFTRIGHQWGRDRVEDGWFGQAGISFVLGRCKR